jgi:predicted nucleic acid-binding protein
MAGLTLDTGALIALDRGDRRIGVMLARIEQRGERVTIPATVIAQAVRHPAGQARIMRLARHGGTDVVPLDAEDAVAVGRLLAASRTADVADAHVVLCARRAGQRVVTSDPGDLMALDHGVQLIAL